MDNVRPYPVDVKQLVKGQTITIRELEQILGIQYPHPRWWSRVLHLKKKPGGMTATRRRSWNRRASWASGPDLSLQAGYAQLAGLHCILHNSCRPELRVPSMS